jgi:hypothetical protein
VRSRFGGMYLLVARTAQLAHWYLPALSPYLPPQLPTCQASGPGTDSLSVAAPSLASLCGTQFFFPDCIAPRLPPNQNFH